MSHPVANNDPAANATFESWLSSTNELAQLMSDNVVTTSSTANGEVTPGNAYMSGVLAVNVFAAGSLSGGNVQTSNTLPITSNVVITNGSFISIGNSSVNTVITSTSVITTTLIGNTSQSNALSFGNSIVNSSMNSVAVVIQNASSELDLTASGLSVGNVTANDTAVVVGNTIIGETSIIVGTSGIVTNTSFNGTSNNATNFGGEPPSYYANASSLLGLLTAVQVNEILFTSNGTYTKNANLLWAEVIVVGAGGGGLSLGSGSSGANGAGGGGGGGTAIKNILTSQLRSSEPVVVGIGGSGTGSNSSFGNSGSSFTQLKASGGQVGQQPANHSQSGLGGTGGVATGGTLNISGEDGGPGACFHLSSAGDNNGQGGQGGDSTYGKGGMTIDSISNDTNGNPGKLYGGGGAGAARGDDGNAQSGGIGANGMVMIVEYYSV
jgi:hypothetical protein